jgi:hypothetical protein
MHQEIAAFQIPGLNWTNVEATLLTTVTYFDPTVFSPSQMELAKNHENDFIGIRGLINSDFLVTLSGIWEYMVQINYLFYALIGIIFFTLCNKKNRTKVIDNLFHSVYIPFLLLPGCRAENSSKNKYAYLLYVDHFSLNSNSIL